MSPSLFAANYISIHSPRMGRDEVFAGGNPVFNAFQSTLPAWGETQSPTRTA